MALIICPECGKQISDKAPNCPGCGFPIKDWLEEEKKKYLEEEKKQAALIPCPYCGEIIDKNEDYCDYCGMKINWQIKAKEKEIEELREDEPYSVCPSCNHHNRVGIFRCVKCGYTYKANEYVIHTLKKDTVYCPRCGSTKIKYVKKLSWIKAYFIQQTAVYFGQELGHRSGQKYAVCLDCKKRWKV